MDRRDAQALPLLQQITREYDREPKWFPRSSKMFTSLGDLCSRNRDFQHAEKFYLKAWQIQAQDAGENDASTIPILVSLGTAYMEDGNLKEAEKPLEKAAALERSMQRNKKMGYKPHWRAIAQYIHFLRATHQNELADRWIEDGIPAKIRNRFFPGWMPPQAPRRGRN